MNTVPAFVARMVTRQPPSRVAYAVGVAVVVAAVFVRVLLAATIGTSLPLVVHVIAVFVAAFFGGARASVLAILLSAAVLLLGPVFGGPMAGEGSVLGRVGQVVLLAASSVIPVLLVLAMRASIAQEELLRTDLQRTQRRLQDALAAGRMGTFDYSVDRNESVWDENTYRLWGVAPGTKITAATYQSRIHPDDLPTFWADRERALDPAGDGVRDVTYRTRGDDGDAERWIRSIGRVEFDPGTRKPVRIVGTSRDVTAEMRAQAERDVLLGELSHRMKNLFAVTQAVLSMSHREAASKEDALELARSRIDSLARAHAHSLGHEDEDLQALVEAVLAPLGAGRISVSGPPVTVSADRLTATGMALHELATNAAKHGALSTLEGWVEVSWTVEGDTVRLLWRERGGPRLAGDEEQGFGSRLLAAVTQQIGGRFNRKPCEGGLDATLDFPVS